MVIATIDIGGTSIKFASMTAKGQLLKRHVLPTPNSWGEFEAWLDECMAEESYEGLAISAPGAVNQETGVIAGTSAVPFIHGFSWYEVLSKYKIPISLENDANCVGLSELLARPDLKNVACVVIGTGIGGALIFNGRLHRGKHDLGGEYGYMVLRKPKEDLGNWSRMASTGALVRYVKEQKKEKDWNGQKIYQAAAKGDIICQRAIEHMNYYLALGILNIQYCFDPDLICLGGSISQNPLFLGGVQKQMVELVAKYEEYVLVPEVVTCTYKADANLYGALVHWLQRQEEEK